MKVRLNNLIFRLMSTLASSFMEKEEKMQISVQHVLAHIEIKQDVHHLWPCCNRMAAQHDKGPILVSVNGESYHGYFYRIARCGAHSGRQDPDVVRLSNMWPLGGDLILPGVI